MHTRQLANFALVWPMTFRALDDTFFSSQPWGVTRSDGHNDAGYLLQSLARYERQATAQHSHKGIDHHSLDRAAAAEVRYQHARASTFRRPAAGLSACICALPSERPEKLFAAIRKDGKYASKTPVLG